MCLYILLVKDESNSCILTLDLAFKNCLKFSKCGPLLFLSMMGLTNSYLLLMLEDIRIASWSFLKFKMCLLLWKHYLYMFAKVYEMVDQNLSLFFVFLGQMNYKLQLILSYWHPLNMNQNIVFKSWMIYNVRSDYVIVHNKKHMMIKFQQINNFYNFWKLNINIKWIKISKACNF